MLVDLNASSVSLQVYAVNPDGSPKTDVVSGTVRVYYVDGTGEHVVLAATPLVNVSANIWRYSWSPISLPIGDYVAEYYLIDAVGIATRLGEEVCVRDIARQATLTVTASDISIIRKIETGRWKIDAYQFTFYDDDGTTPLLVFDLKDSSGSPTVDNVFERDPV